MTNSQYNGQKWKLLTGNKEKEQHNQFACKKKKTKNSRRNWRTFPTNKKKDKTRELRKLIETINLRHPGENYTHASYPGLVGAGAGES